MRWFILVSVVSSLLAGCGPAGQDKPQAGPVSQAGPAPHPDPSDNPPGPRSSVEAPPVGDGALSADELLAKKAGQESTGNTEQAGYRFTINGRPSDPSFVHLEGTPEQAAPGDLVEIGRFWMVLGPQKVQAYHTSREEDGVVWVDDSDGRRSVAAVRVESEFTDEKDSEGRYKQRFVNRLATLTPDEIRGLRGLDLDSWSDELPKLLRHLNVEQVCITISGDTAAGEARRFPPLPAGLRHLVLRETNNFRGIQDYRPLGDLKELRYLSIDIMTGPLDCRHIERAKRLRHLSLQADDLPNAERLGALSELRHLDLNYNRSLRSVAFVANLTKLEVLSIRRTGVEDLAVLAGHPALRQIDARSSPLKRLPADKPLPALKRLEALSTQVSQAEAEAFARLNPQCTLTLRWAATLAKAVEGADRVRVRSGGTCHRNIAEERTLYEEKDEAKIRELIQQVQIDEAKSQFHCQCCGDPSLEFYQDGKLLATVGYHHGRGLRWVEGWPGDALMTAECARYFETWLADHIQEIKASQEAERAYRKKQAEEVERFVGHFPEKVRSWLRAGGEVDPDDGDKELGRRIAAAMPDEKALSIASCRAFGSLEGSSASWTSTTGKERRVLSAVHNVGGEAFLEALEALKEDRPALLGAARLFFFEDFDDRIAEKARVEWTERLAEMSLQDGADDNKSMVLRHLGWCHDDRTLSLLRDVMAGRKGTEFKEPDHDEPGLRAGAAVSLGLRKVTDIKPVVEKLLATAKRPGDTAALQVTLALLGDASQLRAEHFQLWSGTIGWGAIQAVERFRGVHGLDLLVEKGMDHPWGAVRDDAELAVQRLVGQEWPERERRDAIRAWWKTHGQAFVEQRRKEK